MSLFTCLFKFSLWIRWIVRLFFFFLLFPSVVFFFGRVSSYSSFLPSQMKTESRKEGTRKKERQREREHKRVNQTAGDVRPWRRTNSIHLGARDRIWWHNRNIWNRKSLALPFSLSFFCVLSQAVFYDSLDALLSLSCALARARALAVPFESSPVYCPQYEYNRLVS